VTSIQNPVQAVPAEAAARRQEREHEAQRGRIRHPGGAPTTVRSLFLNLHFRMGQAPLTEPEMRGAEGASKPCPLASTDSQVMVNGKAEQATASEAGVRKIVTLSHAAHYNLTER